MNRADPATKRFEHRGIVFFVGSRAPCPGIGWAIETFDHLGCPKGFRESQGAFYDGCDDHPEGAYLWAEKSCRDFIDREIAP